MGIQRREQLAPLSHFRGSIRRLLSIRYGRMNSIEQVSCNATVLLSSRAEQQIINFLARLRTALDLIWTGHDNNGAILEDASA